jgi:hypothetical protein
VGQTIGAPILAPWARSPVRLALVGSAGMILPAIAPNEALAEARRARTRGPVSS